MNKKGWIYALCIYVVLTGSLIYLFNRCWPNEKVTTSISAIIVGALITNLIRKVYDIIFDFFTKKTIEPYLGVSIHVDHSQRRFTGYGASCGEIIQAGNFRANYDFEADLIITIQNESIETVYEVEVSFIPNNYSNRFTLIDSRQNKLQPIEGNKHIDFTLRITKTYNDVYASDVDKDIHELYKIGKYASLLNGSKICIKYKDSKHREHTKTETIL